jgi:hypothetical protein
MMASTVIDWESVKLGVLKELEHRALRPTDLLNILGDRYPDTVIKESVLRLLQDQSIKMTPDQQLQVAEGDA